MIVKCKFDASINELATVGEDGLYIRENACSPLLDECVKVIYPPKDMEIPLAVITFRFFMEKCLLCGGSLCVAATTDQLINDRVLTVIHCNEVKEFAYVGGIPKSRSNNEV